MLQERNIAFFIDVDNCGLSSEDYAGVLAQLSTQGNILYGKVYGAGERKHKEIYADARDKGYIMERPMRVKRRGRKDFDPRIFVDVVDAVSKTPAIDAVCIIAQPTDLVYLYSYLRSRGIKIIALDNADEASCAFVDEVIDTGMVVELKMPKAKPAAKPEAKPAKKQQPAPAKAPANDDLDRTDELLKEIERLRALADNPQPAKAQEKPSKPAKEEPASIVDETNALLDKIAEMQQPEEQPQPEQAEEPVEAKAHRATYAPTNDSDLIRRIEEIRRNSQGDDEDFVEEIRKLLDGLE